MAAATGGRGSILIVEDDLDFAVSFAELLGVAGWETAVARSRARAREIVEAAHVKPRVVFIDVRLGDGTGLEVLEDIKALAPDALCIMMTAYSSSDAAIHAVRLGAFDYLRKPFDPAEAFAALDRAISLANAREEAQRARQQLAEQNAELERRALFAKDALALIRDLTYERRGEDLARALAAGIAELTEAKGVALYWPNGEGLTLVASHGLEDEPTLRGVALGPRHQIRVVSRGIREARCLGEDLSPEHARVRGGRQCSLYAIPRGGDHDFGGVCVLYDLPTEGDRATSQRALVVDLLLATASSLLVENEARVELERSRRQIEAIVALAADGILCIDEAQRITLFNAEAEEIFGYSASEVIGQPLSVLVPEEARAGHAGYVAAMQHAPSRVLRRMGHRQAVRGRRKSGESFPLEVSFSAGGGLGHASAIVRDQTEQERAEEMQRRAQRLEAIGRLAGNIAHDLNNTLSSVATAAAIIAEEVSGRPEEKIVANEAHVLVDAVKRADALVRSLLALGRQQKMKNEVVDLNEVIGKLAAILSRAIGRGIDLRLESWSQPLFVYVDVGQLEQVILNLVVNARDALPEGGHIVLRVEPGRPSAPVMPSRRGAPVDRFAVVWVEDDGVGIAPDVLAHVFEPFFTTKSEAAGSGLGLSSAYAIIAQSGGTIEVTSKEGQGTTFSVFLPLEPEPGTPDG